MKRYIPLFDERSDRRAVSEVLGAILIFALVLSLVVIIQVAAVPALNQQIEFAHNQRAQGDMQLIGQHIEYTAATGAETSTSIEMGVYYPTRIFLLNPPPAAASLTTSQSSITLTNAKASGETADYWDGASKTFESQRLAYQPDYNEYASAPKTVYEGWTLYNEHPNSETDISLDETSPINGKRIRLVALDGRRSETSTAPVTVAARPLSVPEQSVAVHGADGKPIELTFETKLSKAAWSKTFASETCADTNDDNTCDQPDATGHIVDWRVTNGKLHVVLEKGVTYDLRMSKVGIGSGATQEPAHYMTAISSPKVLEPGGTELTVEVRDRFNTVESGVDVSFRVEQGSGSASLSQATVTTNEKGMATIRAVPTSDDPVTIIAEADLDGDGTIQERERVRFSNLPVSDSRESRDPSEVNPNDDDAVVLENAVIRSTGTGNQKKYFVDVTWRNRYSQDKSIEALRVNFYGASALGGRSGTSQLLYVKVGTKTMQVRSPYTYNLGLAPSAIGANNGTATYRFEFLYTDSQGNLVNFQPLEGDFFIVSVKFTDGATARYFIDPRNP